MDKEEYLCTECGGDATIGMGEFKSTDGKDIYVKKEERLCFKCFYKRTGRTFF